jgi:hypothetical protein
MDRNIFNLWCNGFWIGMLVTILFNGLFGFGYTFNLFQVNVLLLMIIIYMNLNKQEIKND